MNANPMRIAFLLGLLVLESASGAQNVWLDFNAGWNANLATVSSTAGVAAFSEGEITQLENSILDAFAAAYNAYTVDFSFGDPSAPHERVDFGAITTDSTLLGQTTFDFRNRSQGTQDVFVANFATFLESTDDRSEQLAELAATLAGTAAHELGHAFGLQHVYAYGDTRITPDRYGDTMGIQNEHIMATGSTGLSEAGRELTRTFSDWSRLHLEAGSRLSDTTLETLFELFIGDVGSDIATADPLPLQTMDVSNSIAGFAVAALQTEVDVDVFEVLVDASSLLSAEIWSSGGLFDGTLRLFDGLGEEIAFGDNVLYSPTTVGSGTQFSADPWLLNVPVQPGSYYLEVGSLTPISTGFGNYELTLGLFAVPEAALGMRLGLCLVMAMIGRRRDAASSGTFSVER